MKSRIHLLRAFRPVDYETVFSLSGDLLAEGIDHTYVAKLSDEVRVGRIVDQPAYRRQGVSPTKLGMRYPSHTPNEIRLAGM